MRQVQSIHTCDSGGLGIYHHIHSNAPNGKWEDSPGHFECDKYAQRRGAKKQRIREVGKEHPA